MTARVKSLTVALTEDVREDDVERLIDAIKMLGWVLAVAPTLATHQDWVIEERVKRDLRERLWKVLCGEEQI